MNTFSQNQSNRIIFETNTVINFFMTSKKLLNDFLNKKENRCQRFFNVPYQTDVLKEKSSVNTNDFQEKSSVKHRCFTRKKFRKKPMFYKSTRVPFSGT